MRYTTGLLISPHINLNKSLFFNGQTALTSAHLTFGESNQAKHSEMSESDYQSSGQLTGFLKQAGFTVHNLSNKITKKTSKSRKKEPKTAEKSISESQIQKCMPGGESFKQQLQQFSFQKVVQQGSTDGNIFLKALSMRFQQVTRDSKQKQEDQADQSKQMEEQFRGKLKQALMGLSPKQGRKNNKQPRIKKLNSTASKIRRQKIQRPPKSSAKTETQLAQEGEVQGEGERTECSIQKSQNSVQKRKGGKLLQKKIQVTQSRSIVNNTEERKKFQKELTFLKKLEGSLDPDETHLKQQITNKKQAIKSYLQLIKFERKEVWNERQQKLKRRLYSLIFEEPLLRRGDKWSKKIGPTKQYQKRVSRQVPKKEDEMDTTADFDPYAPPVRLTRQNIKAGQKPSTPMLQLSILPKFKKTLPVQSPKVPKPPGSKQIKKKVSKELLSDEQSSFKEDSVDSLSAKIESIQCETMLLKRLPVRNPIIKHDFNSLDHAKISYLKEFQANGLYFVSDLLSYKGKATMVKVKSNSKGFVEEALKSTKNCRGLVMPQIPTAPRVKLKRNFEYTNKKVVMLDLDQTLVHSLPLNTKPNKDMFPLQFDFEGVTRHFAIRHYAPQLIKNLSKTFYLVLFTSAAQGYADKVLEFLDPEDRYFQHRLYRGHCYLKGENYPYIKDLRIINRDLSQVVIVDNSLYAYWFQVDNGIPIANFMGQQDSQLVRLQQYLLKLELVDDVRPINRRMFHMHLYQEEEKAETVLQKYCEAIGRQREEGRL